MKSALFSLLVVSMLFPFSSSAKTAAPREFYQLRIYSLNTAEQLKTTGNYLSQALLPALHKSGIKNIGVFEAIANDTAAIKKIYVLIPLKSLNDLTTLDEKIEKDASYQQNGKEYLDAPHNNPPYARMESIILEAFPDMPTMRPTTLTGPKSERIYELRSYEGPTEKLYKNKVKMFNDGGEIKLFDRLQFHSVFYAEVLSGSRMPNLMYLTTFENMASHDEHWKSFVNDAEWKKLSAMPEYQNNVSKADIMLLHPTEYSDY
jgi:hypothetical protein